MFLIHKTSEGAQGFPQIVCVCVYVYVCTFSNMELDAEAKM